MKCKLINIGMIIVLLNLISSGMGISSEKHGIFTLWDTQKFGADIKTKGKWRKVEDISYSFKGDPAIENKYLTAIFCREKGKVIIYSNNGGDKVEVFPFKTEGNKPSGITSYNIKDKNDKIRVEACFSSKDGEVSTIFSFWKDGIVEVRPDRNMDGVSVLAQIEFGMIPGIVGDSLIYNPEEYSFDKLYLPSENIFLGLLEGENSMLVSTWPEGEQKVALIRGKNGENTHIFKSFNIQIDGKSVYLTMLSAPGIWHRERLDSSYLEKDVLSKWKKPFGAQWRVQVFVKAERPSLTSIKGILTDFYIQAKKCRRWGMITSGWWQFPAWFEGMKLYFHFSKKIPPVGDAIVYFIEGISGTPIDSPVDIMKKTLGEDFTNTVLDFEGRKRRPRGEVKIYPYATCGARDRMKKIFEAGREVEEREVIKAYTEDIQSFFAWEKQRAEEYLKFSKEMQEFCKKAMRENPELRPSLNEIEMLVKEIEGIYSEVSDDVTAENLAKMMKKIISLTRQHRPDNLATFLSIRFTAISGAYDGPNRRASRIAEKILEKAGKLFVNSPEAVKIGEEIRKRTKEVIRHPVAFEREYRYI